MYLKTEPWDGAMKDAKLKNESGFSLLEVLVALTLAGVVVAVIAFSFQQITTLEQQINGRVTAEVLGTGKLAELTTGSQTVSSGEFPAPYQRYRWSAREEQGETGGNRTIVLTVEWNGENGYTHRKEFKGYVGEE